MVECTLCTIPPREQCAVKVVNFEKTISRSCCRGLINELRVLHLLGSDQSAMPFLLRPYLLDARWAWRSEAKYPHSGGDLEQYRWKLTEDSLALVCSELVRNLLFNLASRGCQ
ncbi:hypothetical protein OH76DRAFT_697745 [Lentinus brumalis]|uniref:Uncharacterized protein n=1 Tax=Lentinus brumalis TaxID=2498619 RepID=A0A371D6D8_9APHY|nr:hypothetical protein OH76DRAFT_697745 [Polyporus brumalis]